MKWFPHQAHNPVPLFPDFSQAVSTQKRWPTRTRLAHAIFRDPTREGRAASLAHLHLITRGVTAGSPLVHCSGSRLPPSRDQSINQSASRYETIQGLARVRSRINRHRPPHSDASFPAPPTHRSTVGAGYSNGPKLSSQHTADTGQAARCGSEDLDGHLRIIHARALSYTHERVVLSTGCLLVGVFDRHMRTATSSAAVEQVPPERARKAASTPTLTPQRRARHIQHSRAARRTTMTPHPHPAHQQGAGRLEPRARRA